MAGLGNPTLQAQPMAGSIRPFSGVNLNDIGSQLYGLQPEPAPAQVNVPNMTDLDPAAITGPAQIGAGTMEPGQWEQVGDALLNDLVAPADQLQGKGGGGIGLQNTLGILNMGAGLGSQIYKMATAKKQRRPRRPTPMPGGGNPMR